MLKKTIALIGLTLSLTSQAATVSYSGYTLDTTTNIVTGGGLEWLQWTETADMSIDQALAGYESAGWRVASVAEMAAMLNDFDFGKTFEAIEQDGQHLRKVEQPVNSITSVILNQDAQFLQLFGSTVGNATRTSFEEDADGDSLYNTAYFQIGGAYDWISLEVGMNGDGNQSDWVGSSVALVQPSAVPLPAAAWLFGSAILGLVGVARRKQA